jgi:hypothetical protein
MKQLHVLDESFGGFGKTLRHQPDSFHCSNNGTDDPSLRQDCIHNSLHGYCTPIPEREAVNHQTTSTALQLLGFINDKSCATKLSPKFLILCQNSTSRLGAIATAHNDVDRGGSVKLLRTRFETPSSAIRPR